MVCKNCDHWTHWESKVGKCEKIAFAGEKQSAKDALLENELESNAYIYSWWYDDKPENKGGLLTSAHFYCPLFYASRISTLIIQETTK